MKIEMVISVLVVIVVTLWRLGDVTALPSTINIGAIIDKEDAMQELAMRYAVERVNRDPQQLPRSTLQAHIDIQPADDSFQAAKKVCNLLGVGVAAIFGPQSENTANHVQSICDNKEIPHIETRYDYKLTRDAYSINLHPYPPSLSKAYYDIIKQFKWESFVILYDSNESLVRLQRLLQEKAWKVHLRQVHQNTDNRPLLKQIAKYQETRFVVDVKQSMILDVLREAGQVGLMTKYNSYFITSLDFNHIPLDEFRYSDTNITGIQLIDPKSNNLRNLINNWIKGEEMKGRSFPAHFSKITTGAALMFDAVILFASALTKMEKSQEFRVEKLNCVGDRTWNKGSSLINFMKMYGSVAYTPFDPRYHSPREMMMMGPRGTMGGRSYYNMGRSERNYTREDQVRVVGLTGLLKFDDAGFRSDFNLDIIEMDINNNTNSLNVVGNWTVDEGAIFTRMWGVGPDGQGGSLYNRTLVVSTALTEPYVFVRKSKKQLFGNDRYQGFCIDIIKEIAKMEGFNYTIEESPGGAYGNLNKTTGKWDGIIGELINRRADLGIVDLSITHEREEAVDFTMPFMNLGISIIYTKPKKKSPSLFSFMSPFSVDVWIYMATAYLGVSILLFILARVAPQEWDNPHPCIQEPEELENSISLSNAFWFTIGSVMQQGSDIAPKAVSTRIVAGIWWFFTLIMISSYTANLAAFLTVERMDAPIESAEDLAKQTKIKYGCKKGGSTYNFFKNSTIDTYKKMWNYMDNARPPVFTEGNDDGVAKVSKSEGSYAFLMESSSIEYEVERKCNLMQIGGLLDSKSYGIALPPNSRYTDLISSSILLLKENGTLHRLKEKWWKKDGKCTEKNYPKE